MFLRFVYTMFIGVLFATLVGVGIAAFYPEPESPDYPRRLEISKPVNEQTTAEYEKQEKMQDEYDKAFEAYQDKQNVYSRNVSIVSLVIAIAILVVSLTLFKPLQLIADGLLFGGLLTLLYSIIRGFSTDDNMFRFIVVAIGFITAMIIGYIKFVKPAEAKQQKKKK